MNTSKNVIDISSKESIEKDKIDNYIDVTEKIDKDNFVERMKHLPNFIEETKVIIKAFEKTVDVSKDLSVQYTEYYKDISKAILVLLEKDNISEDNKELLIKLLKKNGKHIKSLNKNDKKFMRKQFNKLIKYGTMAVGVLGVLMGAKYIKQKKYR